MTRIAWSQNEDRQFETGLDRGVLYPKVGAAVSWDGLISVEENGAESSAEFFMDGRPFLYLPTPKEFRATLTAYTYPDEFSALIGTEEITDGMYLDSQAGDSFGLSYRTLIGDAILGTTRGYKLHLVYNATAAPQGYSYATLSDSPDPSDFAFDIQAVPVPVENHRPTAHVVIDTRHMDIIRLTALENLLYGTSSTSASLPTPDVIFETLSFGDTIVITDNGDGTWTAEGSFANVQIIGPGIFQINNVSAISHGDGTYDISTTP